MRSVITVPSAVMNNLRGYPHLAGIADQWRDTLPERAEQLCSAFDLELTGESPTGGFWSVLLVARDSEGTEVVIKLCADKTRLGAEAAALNAWSDAPAVEVLGQAPDALLLARVLPGREMRLNATQLSELLVRLKRPAEDDALIEWRGRVTNTAARIPALARAADVEMRVDAHALGEEVVEGGEARPLVVLHGDLHPGNFLDQGGDPVVIDPYGISGPWELDVANCAINNEWDSLDARARVLVLAKLTGSEPELTMKYARLYALLDGCYHAANHTQHAWRSGDLLSFAAAN